MHFGWANVGSEARLLARSILEVQSGSHRQGLEKVVGEFLHITWPTKSQPLCL